MNISDTFQFWGLSDSDETLKKYIKSNSFDKVETFVGDKEYFNSKYTTKLSFKSVNLFKHYYYNPKQIFTSSIEEGFFIGFSVGDFYGKPNFPFALPYNLTFNDNYSAVKTKLKISSSKKTKLENSSYCEFNFDTFSLLTYFSLDDKLIYLVFKLFEKSTLIKTELQKSFKAQDKNIKPESLLTLGDLKNTNPTIDWNKRLIEGDTIFNEKNITQTSLLLDNFIEELKISVVKVNSKGIFSATKKVVKSLNTLNEKLEYFINTIEREELFEYIDKCITATGFQVKEGFDITEEWREW